MRIPLSVLALLATLSGPAALAASRDVDEHRSADPNGQVEIVGSADLVVNRAGPEAFRGEFG